MEVFREFSICKQDEIYALETQIAEIDVRKERLNLSVQNVNINNKRSMDQLNSLKQAEFKLSYQNVLAPIDGYLIHKSLKMVS